MKSLNSKLLITLVGLCPKTQIKQWSRWYIFPRNIEIDSSACTTQDYPTLRRSIFWFFKLRVKTTYAEINILDENGTPIWRNTAWCYTTLKTHPAPIITSFPLPVYHQPRYQLHSSRIQWVHILQGTDPLRIQWEGKFYHKLHHQLWPVSFWLQPFLCLFGCVYKLQVICKNEVIVWQQSYNSSTHLLRCQCRATLQGEEDRLGTEKEQTIYVWPS